MMRLRGLAIVLAATVCLSAAAPARGITIQFDYRFDSSGFFSNPLARAALESAAETFNVLLDTLTAISPSGSNRWSATFFNPSTGITQVTENLFVPANTLIVFAGARDLPGNQLGEGGPGGFNAGGSQAWLNTVVGRGNGVQSDVTGILAHEFAPWGGAITFDTTLPNGQPRNWHFDLSTDPARNTTDLFSVAVHELGHLLGFGTADSFRARVISGHFNGPQAMALNNGNPIRLNADNSHWASETKSPPWDPNGPIASMDPTITSINGFMKRRHFTPLDFAALDDIGWIVDPSVYVSAPPSIPGDYNNNGIVEQADLDLVLLNWGQSASAVPPTWTNDLPMGIVDQSELDRVLLNWGNMAAFSAPPSAAALSAASVPEPRTWLMGLVICVTGLISRAAARFRRRHAGS